jgi:hypothetical protein
MPDLVLSETVPPLNESFYAPAVQMHDANVRRVNAKFSVERAEFDTWLPLAAEPAR